MRAGGIMIYSSNKFTRAIGLALACSALGACATTSGQTSRSSEADLAAMLSRMMSYQSRTTGAEFERIREQASAHPLGSSENPVRAEGPRGQRAYLSRLRCSDTSRPSFYRVGNVGPGIYRNIVDLYEVKCDGAEPTESKVYMDMYHSGHIETEAVPGFGIAGGRRVEE